MQIKDWGEEGLIHHLEKNFPYKSPIVGIGDDCAVIPSENGEAWLVTTDALIEGIHFLKEQIPPMDLGYKTLAVNLSDIAAMGGTPKYAFLTIALPKTTDSEWICSLIQGIKEACKEWNILLLGGDTVGSKRDIFLNLTLIGSTKLKNIKYRHQAQVSDIICVTGYLGDSGGGLKALQENLKKTKNIKALIEAHFHPTPHLQQGKWLAKQKDVHAMIDLSDGLDIGLNHLITHSAWGAEVEISKIPLSKALLQTCLENNWDPLQLALTGGEDYCLLFTVSPEAFPFIKNEFNYPLYEIGRITHQPHQLTYLENDQPKEIKYPKFDHFQ